MRETRLRVEGLITGRRRDGKHFYDEVAKRRLIELCKEGQASVATIALANGVNPNVLHRWLTIERTRPHVGEPFDLPKLLPVLVADEVGDSGDVQSSSEPREDERAETELEIVFARGTLRLRQRLDEKLLQMIADILDRRC